MEKSRTSAWRLEWHSVPTEKRGQEWAWPSTILKIRDAWESRLRILTTRWWACIAREELARTTTFRWRRAWEGLRRQHWALGAHFWMLIWMDGWTLQSPTDTLTKRCATSAATWDMRSRRNFF